MRRVVAIGLMTMVAWVSMAGAQDDIDPVMASYIRSHYSKQEVRIPMRDGVHLFAAVYTPIDHTQTYPILIRRTPYRASPYGADRYPDRLGPCNEMAHEGYIFVEQDVRGKYMSEGEFVNMRPHRSVAEPSPTTDESTDTHDTINWLLEHLEGHNGRVGLWGNSYPGFYTAAGAIDSHPALKAIMPSAPIADWYWDDMHHHGAFVLSLAFNFFSSFGQPRTELTTERPERFDHQTPDGYQFFLDLGPLSNADDLYLKGNVAFWNEIAAHPDYDEFWQDRNILPHLKNMTCAVLVVGGLFDAEDLYGPLNTYRAIEVQNPGINNVLVMGPWSHGAWLRKDGRALGPADFGFATAEVFRSQVMLPFFRHHLRGGQAPQIPEAMIFETGANRWRRFDRWPPENLRPCEIYLSSDGKLVETPPSAGDEDWDEYISDPARPVPFTSTISTGWHAEYMVEDQRFAAWRPDVLVYRSEVLKEDLTVAGPITAHLWVSTSAGDADWVVKLIDEFPGRLPDHDPESDEPDLGGTQRLVRSEVLRGRYRNSYSDPEPFQPGQPTEVRVPLQDVLHTFKRGHRVMIQIQSSMFPFIDRNPQGWVDNIFEATQDDFVQATHRVYRSQDHPSRIELSVIR